MTDEPTDDLMLQPLAGSTPQPAEVPASAHAPEPAAGQPTTVDLAPSEPGDAAGQQPDFAVSDLPTPAASAPLAAGGAASSAAAAAACDWLPEGRPELEQTLRNLRVWLPFLANPNDRRLQVRFSPDDDRVGLTWKVSLPQLCWHCGKAEGLTPRTYEGLRRSFEYAVGVVTGTAAAALLALLIAFIWPFFGSVLFLFVLLIGAAVLWLKSWKEEVRLTFWTCSDHAGPMKAPSLVIDDQQLHVTLGNAELVAAATEDIRERRRTGAGRKALGGTGSTSAGQAALSRSESPRPETSRPLQRPPRPAAPKPAELPPIKLSGDDE